MLRLIKKIYLKSQGDWTYQRAAFLQWKDEKYEKA